MTKTGLINISIQYPDIQMGDINRYLKRQLKIQHHGKKKWRINVLSATNLTRISLNTGEFILKYDFINGSSILIIVWMTIAIIIRVTNWKFNKKTDPAISLFLAFPASIVILLVYIFFFDKWCVFMINQVSVQMLLLAQHGKRNYE